MKIFNTNQNKPEQILRFILAVVLIPIPFVFGFETYPIIAGSVGLILLFNSLVGTCYNYWVFGVNTCETPKGSSK